MNKLIKVNANLNIALALVQLTGLVAVLVYLY